MREHAKEYRVRAVFWTADGWAYGIWTDWRETEEPWDEADGAHHYEVQIRDWDAIRRDYEPRHAEAL